jgi:hypothetical protein
MGEKISYKRKGRGEEGHSERLLESFVRRVSLWSRSICSVFLEFQNFGLSVHFVFPPL